MEWLITEQCAWFIFGGIIGYTFMFIIALISIRRLKSYYKTEIYSLRLSLKNEQDRNKILKDEIKLVDQKARCLENRIDLISKRRSKNGKNKKLYE